MLLVFQVWVKAWCGIIRLSTSVLFRFSGPCVKIACYLQMLSRSDFMNMPLFVYAQVYGSMFLLLKYTLQPFHLNPLPPSKGTLEKMRRSVPVSFASGHARLRQCLCPSPCAKSKTEQSAQPWRWLLLWYSIGYQSLRGIKCIVPKT